jgi:hypothetical protein
LKSALDDLAITEKYKSLVASDSQKVLQIFEEVFNHKAFTGRSGTFYGYEGLGSIYWHMVSKLHLAVAEVITQSIQNKDDKAVIDALVLHFDAIGDGIGVHKSPEVYGAFPTDPYSHTPFNKGAQQPGMTGQVKEDILTRVSELGVQLNQGKFQFNPGFLKKEEFLTHNVSAKFVTVDGTLKTIELPENSLAFTICQVPVVYAISQSDRMLVHYSNGTSSAYDNLELNDTDSQKIAHRTHEITMVEVFLNHLNLR